MRSTYVPAMAAVILAAACGGEKTPEASAVTAMAVSVTNPELEKVREDYVAHYNMHHASMVGDLFADSAVFLGADGSVDMGKAAIIAGLEQNMGASPTLDVTTTETMMMGDMAVTRGRYQIAMTPPGASQMDISGYYMTLFEREGDAWKIAAVVTNYGGPAPTGLPAPRGGDTPPPENGQLTGLYKALTDNINSGNAAGIASLYTEDGISMDGGMAPIEGREAIEAAVAQELAQGQMTVTVHPVETMYPADGWAIDGGWWEAKTKTAGGEVATTGAYMMVVKKAADGSWKIHRIISNSQPVPAS